jgi:hypothetical protein
MDELSNVTELSGTQLIRLEFLEDQFKKLAQIDSTVNPTHYVMKPIELEDAFKEFTEAMAELKHGMSLGLQNRNIEEFESIINDYKKLLIEAGKLGPNETI